jgi:hypothetical protein
VKTHDSVVAERCWSALRSPQVADAAGVAAASWADAATPRIFRGLAGFLGGRNRGRLPFIEFDIVNQPFAQESVQGGTVALAITIRVHYGSRDHGAASDATQAILANALAALRSEDVDNLCAFGTDQIGPIQASPWGLARDAQATVELSYNRADYGVH